MQKSRPPPSPQPPSALPPSLRRRCPAAAIAVALGSAAAARAAYATAAAGKAATASAAAARAVAAFAAAAAVLAGEHGATAPASAAAPVAPSPPPHAKWPRAAHGAGRGCTRPGCTPSGSGEPCRNAA